MVIFFSVFLFWKITLSIFQVKKTSPKGLVEINYVFTYETKNRLLAPF